MNNGSQNKIEIQFILKEIDETSSPSLLGEGAGGEV